VVLRWSRLLVRSVVAVALTLVGLGGFLAWRVAQEPISVGFLIPYVSEALALPHPLLEIGLKLLVSIYYLGIWIFFFSQFTDYYLDINIVTNDRILDINQKGLFGRVVAELDLTRVQDVHSEIKGIIPTMLNYGTVEIQTAGGEQNFIFEQVPNPHAVRQRIIELAALDRKREARDIMHQTESKDVAAAGRNEMRHQGLG